ncbi:MAG: threonine/serine exporter family protein [Eubacterium sp.]
MKASLLQIAMAAIGTLGFSIYFRVSEKNVIASTAGGAIGWAVYLLIYHLSDNLFVSNFAAAFIVYIWAEIMARILKAPSNTYLIPGIIPLLPGGALYYTMNGLVEGDKEQFITNGINTLLITFGMAAGMVACAVMFHYLLNHFNKSGKGNNGTTEK